MNPEHAIQCEMIKEKLRENTDDLKMHIHNEGKHISEVKSDIKDF